MHDLGQQTIVFDLRCVLWMLQTSLDKTFHLSAVKYLTTMPEVACFDPSLMVSCFNIFVGCLNITDNTPVVVQGLEQLATFSSRFLFQTLRHFCITDPTSNTLEDLRRRYNKVFSSGWADLKDLPFRYTMIGVHILVTQHPKPPGWFKRWKDDRPSAQEHIQLAWCIAEVAQLGYRQTQHEKVPRWTLRFALDSLSMDPPPPPSVVADCLKIIAIDLGCDISNIMTPAGW